MLPRIAYLSTYPPRRCGIATFTRDLVEAVGSGEVVAIHKTGDPILYPLEVAWHIDRDNRRAYRRAAAQVNARGIDAVSIQHEFGIFGGPDGSYVLDFIDRLEIPAVTTFHTVLRQPSESQRDIVNRLARRSAAVVVMSNGAGELLREGYGVPDGRIRVIHHGTPDLPAFDPIRLKSEMGVAGRTVILSFGLLGPGKGYEQMIEAMASVKDAHPEALYVVLGATHPEVLRSDGERYRRLLESRVEALGLGNNVAFVDRFVTQAELGRWLQAADIFATPYPNLDQAVSGTLSYALAAGKAIISTPYAYAKELLSDGRGLLVEPNSPQSISDALGLLLRDDVVRGEMARRAYAFGRRMVWRRVGASYLELLTEASERAASPSSFPMRPDPKHAAMAAHR